MSHRFFRIIFLTAVLASSGCASPPVHHRFWQGIKRQDISTEEFLDDLNKKFIPNTVAQGTGSGLIAYQPVITTQLNKDFPDEVALVTYESEAKYKKLVATGMGSQYQTSHWQYFDRDRSHSTVPEPFKGAFVVGKAYDFFPAYKNWTRAFNAFVAYRFSGKMDLGAWANHAISRDKNLKADGHVVLISDKYFIEYFSWESDVTRQAAVSIFDRDPKDSEFQKLKLIVLPNEKDGGLPIKAGQGVNLFVK